MRIENDIQNEDAFNSGLQIRLFGAFEVHLNGVPTAPLRSRKVQWLLALLVLRHHQPLDRVWLAGTLWPNSAPEQAQYNLRQSLSNLRHTLGATPLRFEATAINAVSVTLAGAGVDVVAFDAAIADGTRAGLHRAVALYRGPLLEGCAEEWALTERRVREESYLNALTLLADHSLAEGNGNAAIPYLQAAVQADPFRERTQRALLQSLSAAGSYAAAVQAYRDLRLLLRRELNSDPDPETVTLFEQIRSEARRLTPVSPALPDAPLPSSVRQLPSPLTPLVGRRAELEQIVTTLRASRLVTLMGTGGVGKTRLAIAAAEQTAVEYPDGVCFVDLAPLSDPDLIVQAVASALAVREEAGQSPFQTLQAFLRSKTLLLLLDNCEHLLDSCARFTDELLRNCPRMSVLATSRQSLRLTGEVKWTVPSLSTPVLSDLVKSSRSSDKEWLSLLSEYEAVELFVTRAQQSLPAFQMSAHNADYVAQICSRLDGLPLALELAAARVHVLSVEEINSRLNDRFRLLTGGSRAALPRQQTLRAMMDWSYGLLNASEKVLLCRLAVFAGGWRLAAAEQVCTEESLEGEEVFEAWEVLDLLTSLVDKSLVRVETADGQTRYRLLETIRQYAQERLQESGEIEQVRQQHLAFFLTLVEEAEPHLMAVEQVEGLHRLEQDHDNLRQAMEGSSPEMALRIAGSLASFWEIRGYYAEGRKWLETRLIGDVSQTSLPTRAKALNVVGSLAFYQGDYAVAQARHEQALALYQDLGNKEGMARSLVYLGHIASVQGDYPTARSLYAESLTLSEAAKNKVGTIYALSGLGNIASVQGNHPAARSLHEQCLVLSQEAENEWCIASSLNNLGYIAYEEKRHTDALALYKQSLALFEALRDKAGIAEVLNGLGQIALESGDHLEALSFYEQSLKQFDETGDKRSLAYVLEDFAALAAVQGQSSRSAMLWGAAEMLRERIGCPLSLSERTRYDQQVAQARRTLKEDAFALAWTQGRTLTLTQAIQYAKEETV